MEGEGLLLVLCSAIIGNDNGGALLRWSGGPTVTRREHQCHCNCSVVRGCWDGNHAQTYVLSIQNFASLIKHSDVYLIRQLV